MQSTMHNVISQQRRLVVLAVVYLVFLGLGIMTATVGPTIPELAANTRAAIDAVGAIFAMNFVGAILGQIITGATMDRLGLRGMLIGGLVISGSGTLGLTLADSLSLLLAAALITGFGHGMVDVTAQILIANVFVKNNVRALNSIHMFFGVGAVIGPAIASLTLRGFGTAIPVLWLGAGLLTFSALLIFVIVQPTMSITPEHDDTAPTLSRRLYKTPLLWTFGILLGLYIGAEVGMGGWTSLYMERTTDFSADTAALVVSGFWLSFTLGRLVSTVLGGRMSAWNLLALALGGALGSSLLMALSAGSPTLTIIAVLLIGLSFAPTYATVIALVTVHFRRAQSHAVSFVVVMGSVGALGITWMQGVILERVSPQASIFFVSVVILMMIGVYSVGRTLAHSSDQLSTGPVTETVSSGSNITAGD